MGALMAKIAALQAQLAQQSQPSSKPAKSSKSVPDISSNSSLSVPQSKSVPGSTNSNSKSVKKEKKSKKERDGAAEMSAILGQPLKVKRDKPKEEKKKEVVGQKPRIPYKPMPQVRSAPVTPKVKKKRPAEPYQESYSQRDSYEKLDTFSKYNRPPTRDPYVDDASEEDSSMDDFICDEDDEDTHIETFKAQ